MNKRRKLFVALGGVLALPRFALAQQTERIYRLGWMSTSATRSEPYNVAFVQWACPPGAAALTRASRPPDWPGLSPTRPPTLSNFLCDGSTDANAALAQGIPALSLGCARGSDMHSPSERIERASIPLGAKQLELVLGRLLT